MARGGTVIDPDVVARLVDRRRERGPLDELTEREREVLALMAEGRTNQAIAERLFVTLKTVEAHSANIFSKLGLLARARRSPTRAGGADVPPRNPRLTDPCRRPQRRGALKTDVRPSLAMRCRIGRRLYERAMRRRPRLPGCLPVRAVMREGLTDTATDAGIGHVLDTAGEFERGDPVQRDRSDLVDRG